MKLLGIVRVSTEQQAGKDGEGLERQRHSVREIAKREGVTDLRFVEIVDVSGSAVGSSREWLTVVVPAIADKDTHVAVDAVDRLIRASNLDLTVLSALQATGTRIYTPAGVRDLARPDDALVSGILALLAGREKSEIVRRAQAGKETRRHRGEWVSGTPPFGTAYDKKTTTWSYTADATKMSEAFRRYGIDREPIDHIAADLGILRNTLVYGFQNPIYKGLLTFDKARGEAYDSKDGKQPERRKVARPAHAVITVRVFGGEAQQPQLVDDGVWQAAQARHGDTSKRVKSAKSNTIMTAWASGFIRPGLSAPDVATRHPTGLLWYSWDETDHVIYGSQTGKGGEHAIRYACKCSTKKHMTPCRLGNPPADRYNIALDRYLSAVTRSTEIRDTVKTNAVAPTNPAAERDRLARDLAACRKREALLTDLYLDGRIDRARHDEKQDGIRAEILAIEGRLAGLADQPAVPDMPAVDALWATWAWDSSWNPTVKRAWLQRHVHAVYINTDGIESVSLRLPSTDGGAIVYAHDGPASWFDLLGNDPTTAHLLPYTAGLLLSDVAERLGTTTAKIKALYRAGKLPEPARRVSSGMRFWTEAEFAATAAAYSAVGTTRSASKPRVP